MTKNLGKTDKYIRAILGIALIAYGLLSGSWSGLAIGAIVIGLVLATTSFMNFCPLYKIAGIKTCNDC